MEVEEVNCSFDQDNIDFFLARLSPTFPEQETLKMVLADVINYNYSRQEAEELGDFCNRLWYQKDWSADDAEDFQIKIAFAEGLDYLRGIMSQHLAYRVIFNNQKFHTARFDTSLEISKIEKDRIDSLEIDRVLKPEPVKFTFSEDDVDYKPVAIRRFLGDDFSDLVKDIHEIRQISVVANKDSNVLIPIPHSMKISFYWYSTRFVKETEKGVQEFNNGMFPLSYFPKHFTLDVEIFDDEGMQIEDHGENYSVIFTGYLRNFKGLLEVEKKHSTRLTDPTDFGFFPKSTF